MQSLNRTEINNFIQQSDFHDWLMIPCRLVTVCDPFHILTMHFQFIVNKRITLLTVSRKTQHINLVIYLMSAYQAISAFASEMQK